MEELICRECGLIQSPSEAKLSLYVMKNGSEHIRAECSACGTWIKWLTKTQENLELVNSKTLPDFDFDTPDNSGFGGLDNIVCDMDSLFGKTEDTENAYMSDL